jgi:hypothetical protein
VAERQLPKLSACTLTTDPAAIEATDKLKQRSGTPHTPAHIERLPRGLSQLTHWFSRASSGDASGNATAP